MSKRQTRTSKATKKIMRTPSPDGSEAGDIEIIEERNTPVLSSRAGVPTARPVPKSKTNISSNFYGAQTSRIVNAGDNAMKVATRSTSGIRKKRIMPDNGEDSASNPDTPSPSKKQRSQDEEDDVQDSKMLTPARASQQSAKSSLHSSSIATKKESHTPPMVKGKEKSKTKVAFNSKMLRDEEDGVSEDWDEEEMDFAFKISRQNNLGDNANAEGSGSKKTDQYLSDDPFVDDVPKNVMPTPPSKREKKYLEDFENFTVKMLPQEDGSFFKQVQDPRLRRQYIGLPPLRIGFFLSWSTSSEDTPHIPYSQWPTVIPDMDIGKDSLLMTFITMAKQGRYFNPSRASPLDIVVREGFRGRHDAFLGKQPAVAVSTGYCTESSLLGGKFKKSIAVLFHGQEWERYCCFVTMIFDQKEVVAQLYNSALTFSTLPESINAPPSFPNATLSPLSGRRAKIQDTSVERAKGALYFSDIVPIFDARQATQLERVDFDALDGDFPRLQGEVPIGSCVAVGHSISTYIGKKADEEKLGTSVNLATNVLFVIVFGTPPN